MKEIDIDGTWEIEPIEILQTVMEMPQGQGGMTMVEMRKRDRVLTVLESVNGAGKVELEDADYEFLKSTYEKFPFAKHHKELLTLQDRIEGAT